MKQRPPRTLLSPLTTFFYLLAAILLFGGCDGGGYSTIDAELAYQRAVEDARVAEVDEVVTTLTAISPDSPALVWEGEPGRSRVLVVTWINGDYYDDYVGRDYSLPDWLTLWVTVSPAIREALASSSGYASEAELAERAEQLLGLPLNSGYYKFVELWVDPADLARPCPDPEIHDTACLAESAVPSESAELQSYTAWFNEQRASSYAGPRPYPWTRLGYTCDWSRGQGCDPGLSEFIIKAGSRVGVKAVSRNDEYLRKAG